MDQFLNKFEKKKREVGEYMFKFGKYKSRSTFNEVWENDKSYLAYLYKNIDHTKNEVLIKFIEDKVTEEAEQKKKEEELKKEESKEKPKPKKKKKTDE